MTQVFGRLLPSSLAATFGSMDQPNLAPQLSGVQSFAFGVHALNDSSVFARTYSFRDGQLGLYASNASPDLLSKGKVDAAYALAAKQSSGTRGEFNLSALKDLISKEIGPNLDIALSTDDIPEHRFEVLLQRKSIAMDVETTGLDPTKDRLCLVQIFDGSTRLDFIRIENPKAPRICRLLESPNVTKIFHHAKFDLGFLIRWLGVDPRNIFCTKIASKLLRDRFQAYGLRDIVRELLGLSIPKGLAKSNWSSPILSQDQLLYSALDVLYLPTLMDKLKSLLSNADLTQLAIDCFRAVPVIAKLDASGYRSVFDH